jgi:NAD(P)-dependent dehydrogenase (short-subunit alcohol dehydrogenase family)
MPDERPQGCAVVTGGNRGIGAAVVERLRADGWTAVAIGRTGGDVQADVSDPAAVNQAFDEIEAEHGPVLALVNNAGITRDNLTLRLTDEDWDAVIATNLTGAFACTRRALSSMMRARWGRIVNVSSVSAERANAGQANYAASKAGLLGLTRTIAREMGKRGITCNAVTPGLIETDMTSDLEGDLEQWIPAARKGRPEEVAAAVAFLCSSDAAYVNGAILAVDGGLAA